MDRAVQFQRGGARADIPEATVRLAVRTEVPPIAAAAGDPSSDVPEMPPTTVSALVDRLGPGKRSVCCRAAIISGCLPGINDVGGILSPVCPGQKESAMRVERSSGPYAVSGRQNGASWWFRGLHPIGRRGRLRAD